MIFLGFFREVILKVKKKNKWRGGRAVQCIGFENQRGLRVTEGSNPSLSFLKKSSVEKQMKAYCRN